MQSSDKKILYFDGGCSICSVAADMFGADFEKKDIRKVELPSHISYEEAQREVHVVDAGGATYAGIDAIIYILKRSAGWKFVARILDIPGIHFLSAKFYRLIASYRHHWFGKK